MTKREAAIVSAYTGVMLGQFSDMHAYIEELMREAVPDGYSLVALAGSGKIRELSKPDFLALSVTNDEVLT